MCRLLGVRALAPVAPVRELLHGNNSLARQSVEHPDGWGIACLGPSSDPVTYRGLAPAHSDLEFARLGATVVAQTIVAHVRLASVGAVHLRNTHPFVREGWVFAHNGTLTDFVSHRQAIEALIAPDLRANLEGETDSERCFALFLTHLRQAPPAGTALRRAAVALGRALRDVSGVTDHPPAKPSSMNLLVTDGTIMLATRRGRTLFLQRQPDQAASANQVLIASEPLWPGGWHELPQETVVGVDAALEVTQWRVIDL